MLRTDGFAAHKFRLTFSILVFCLLATFTSQAQYTKLLDFSGTANGSYPYSSLISDGTFLYGMNQSGGANNLGTIFKVKPDGTGYVKLLDFSGTANGRTPYGSLFFDGTFLYGLTAGGGTSDFGVLFKIKPDGTGYVKLLDFTGVANGIDPEGTLISDGTFLYGTTFAGGANDDGTIFKIKPDGTGYVKLLDLANTTTGREPHSLIYDGTFLYGLAEQGGANFMGAVFKVKTDGTGFTKLLDFAGAANGSSPYGDLITDGAFLYGMTTQGGANNLGTAFKIKTDGTGYIKLLDFAGAANGKGPHGSLTYDGIFLYGMTEQGGTSNLGLLFRLMPDGTGYTKLLDFVGATNGSNPYASLMSDGTFLYGMTVAGGTNDFGTLFKYNIAAVPTITSFAPTSAAVGTTIVINGTNFSTTLANNVVYFGATQASVSAASSTQLTVTVPVGATHQAISVSVGGLMGYSSSPFLVTFPGGGVIDACTFAPKVDFTSDATDWIPGIAISDFDGDGKPDFAVTNNATNTFSVFRNTASPGSIAASSFASAVNFTTGAKPRGLAVDDLDGDGKPDVVVTNHQANTISVFRNTSTAAAISFAAKVDFATGFNPNFVEIADLDADGKPDLVAVNIGSNSISVFKNLSTAGSISASSFAAKVDFTAGTNPYVADIGDLDNDGKPDIVVSNSNSNSISVFKNTSTAGVINTGSFAARVDFATADPDDIVIGDLNGDGKPEITAANWLIDKVSVFENVSSAGVINSSSFGTPVKFTVLQTPESIGISDIDGDGKPDLTVLSQSDAISVLKNTNTGGAINASSFATKVDFAALNTPDDAAIGDLDGDGKPDLIVSNYTDNTLAIYRNTVFGVPSISNFTPASGSTGAPVTIAGTNFSSIPSENIVQFNGTAATVSSSSAISISTTVPSSATTGLISVTVGCNTVMSAGNFTVGGSCIPLAQRNALIAIYNATNGANWTSNTNWLSADESIWLGVTVNGCDVYEIKLEGNNLSGPLPSEIGDLPGLVHLSLKDNKLSGNLPITLGNLSNMDFLGLSNNKISGPIPKELGALNNLFDLDISSNQLSGSIPKELGNLSSLGYLGLGFNQLTGAIPQELGNIPSLVSIDLPSNLLTGSIPTSLGNLTALNFLDLNTNQLTGSIPTELSNTSLSFLRISNNQLTGSIPTSLSNLSNLYLLDIGQNQLTGIIPNQLGNLSLLKFLILNQNKLTGTIPVELGNLTLLEDLIFYDNQLTGSLPVELSQCINLKRFGAGDNQLTGILPKEYGSWTNLTDFGIYNNQITGAVPVEYLAWTAPIHLYFSGNMLDAIPTFTAASITEFNVYDNYFEFGDLESNMGITGYNYSPQAALPGGSFNLNAGTTLTIPFTTTGTANQYQWFKNGVLIPGATSSTFSIPSTTVSDAGNYTVNVTNTIVTGLTLTSLPFVVNITPVIIISPQPSDFIACVGDIATFTTAANGTTNITYQWQYSPNGIIPFVDITNGGGYSNASTATLSVNTPGNFGSGRYRCRINGDLATQVITNDEGLFINALPTAPGTTNTATCSGTSTTVNASGGTNGQYRWYTTSTGGAAIAGEVNSTYTTPTLSSPTTYYVSINNGTCESLRTSLDVSTTPLPSAPTTTGASACGPTASLILNASGGANGQYRWYTVSSAGTAINGEVNSVYTTPPLSLTTIYYVSINNGTCESLRTPVTATIQACNPPAIATSVVTAFIEGIVTIDLTSLISDPDNNLDPSTLKIVAQPASGAVASLSGLILTIDYTGVPFTITETVSIQVCDFTSLCATQQISIEFAADVEVYNAVSPNGDGKNEFLFLRYIEIIPETKKNKVGIYNRWGDEVFSVDDYNNTDRVFAGYSNSGNKLPVGTYFYKISFASGAQHLSGFLVLKY